ncbi:TVP38/TMEM64 family protein [Sanguibacter antarcticus]|uniref:TVP38/TMEM64 family membrane protein n=1 Tax=Sanguibacter antarcticus TaxID=372484 RepID=A0A2A9E207_9MICO|nr:TVP38/TMEM64 family protein [Sanguibacter antarcticus]PFG32873.1 putative membrane protein YdjX (TVP38/TMEM64 family) [Sanguibacter antarcticus]
MNRATVVKASTLVLIVLGAGVLVIVFGTPDVDELRARVDAAGAWAPLLFFALYAALASIPSPVGLLTVAGGALFGMWAGAGLSLAGALVGATIAFGLGRVLGRDAVDRLIRGRLERVDTLLRDHGLSAVLIVRLVPLVPFLAINYASGLSGVRLRHYVVGSAVGMLPGSLAYAALGAYGTNPWGLAGAITGLLVLVAGGAWWARRLAPRRLGEDTAPVPPSDLSPTATGTHA